MKLKAPPQSRKCYCSNPTIPVFFIILLTGALLSSCNQGTGRQSDAGSTVDLPAIAGEILGNKESYYYINSSAYPKNEPSLPVGVFDSGTGGLTVLEAILSVDAYNNETLEEGSDGLPDFADERFIYLADQANMPYGIYSSEGKTDLLVEHVLKDAVFLMSEKYYADASSVGWISGKEPVKTIVVACNTATAYGLPYLEDFIRLSGTGLKVLGVIDAGTRGALQLFQPDESGSIGVLATVGTVASGGYEKTIRRMVDESKRVGEVQVYSQGGQGIAEAVDGERDFADKSLNQPRTEYRGPSLTGDEFKIDKALLPAYNFNFDQSKMLCDTEDPYDCTTMQINDPENYMRYHLVSLLETMRQTPGALPLKVIILGCTHYPYLSATINQVLRELRDFRDPEGYRYRHLMAEEIHLVDPSVNVAIELFEHLLVNNLFADNDSSGTSEFYISVPNLDNQGVRVDENNRFTYEYKYGRKEGEIQQYVKVVPFSRSNISDDTFDRLKTGTPFTYEAIKRFHSENVKLSGMPDSVKLSFRK